ncbi:MULTISPECIES: hypothetical protein [unclassified Lysobacter]|uniref:hypothetical protein n=1 Tax=unclassified Lysobacter TaxID=2635362 RepID=UPI0006FC75E2|nr:MULTISPECIES: hypothetical protein [unclassified Lysobacter]KRC35069.1 hypothetical protein ASE10_10380 [Lysobacter sp. Root76]KRD70758.1 hypothetical protein ASE45_02550 [Lysobacter sp. Root96]
MPNSADMLWFKTRFAARVVPALAGTPLTLDLITALACQETGEVWPVLRRKSMSEERILALCVGDTLDSNAGRSAFPKTKTELVAASRGDEMFAIARKALVDMAVHIEAYQGAASRPNKFCHGFGMFQRDLQFFLDDPDYFLERRYERFEQTLAMCVAELKRGLRKLRLQDRASLTTMELASVAIVYNTGGFRPERGLRQGHFDGTRFYGQAIFDFIRQAQTVPTPDAPAPLPAPLPGEAPVPPPRPIAATGPFFRVDTRVSTLRLRREPRISRPPTANVQAELPDGHPVRAVTGRAVNGFMEVETSLFGALLRGFCSTDFLVRDNSIVDIPIVEPVRDPPRAGVVAVFMPRRPGRVTRRRDAAGAHSLNEDGQPERSGSTAPELREDLGAIIDWLAVDKASHKRYQPHSGLTFCNIYAHDYCHLAGVYLPRVWWSTPAIEKLRRGQTVEPLIADTIFEMRANDLFRWLRDFGPEFGWRQVSSPTRLQEEANQGAVALIVARRKIEGKSGHILPVVPETETEHAHRTASGEVDRPLQSQAGVSNFRYGTSTANWWKDERFAESAFWVHA